MQDGKAMSTPGTVKIQPHHPDCRAVGAQNDPPTMALDPERCCYCAALARGERDPLDYRYGGPGCFCGSPDNG